MYFAKQEYFVELKIFFGQKKTIKNPDSDPWISHDMMTSFSFHSFTFSSKKKISKSDENLIENANQKKNLV